MIMMRKSITPYLLKLDDRLWDEIEDNRMALKALFPSGISKKEFIQNAIIAYNQSFVESGVKEKLEQIRPVEIEDPLSPYYGE
jgi:hypothetical protein